MTSGSFDQAAPGYDQARAFPPGIGERVAAAAQSLLAGRREVLEIGVGTGRIARPLLASGVRVRGLDVSRSMLARLRELLPAGTPPPDLVQGAAEALPLAGASFDAVLSVHVFHLIPDWRASLVEVRRVLRPGGVFLSGHEGRPDEALGTRLMEKWRRIVAARSGGAAQAAAGPGTHDFADIAAALAGMGAHMETVTAGSWTTTRSLARSLEAIEHRTWAGTWPLPAGFFAECLAELRAWALAEFGPLDREFVTPHHFVWQRFAWPKGG